MCGDVIKDYLSPVYPHQINVVRGVKLPRWVSTTTLIVVISYSGNTREALDMYGDARARGLKVVCVSSGGQLISKASKDQVPFIMVPEGIQPRAALGYLLGAVAVILESVGSYAPLDEIRDVIPWGKGMQERLKPQIPTSNNPAKKIAEAIQDTVPVIYVPESIRSVGTRWQNQMNENAKMVAFCGEIPEMNHNQLVGWLSGSDVRRCRPVFILPKEMEPTIKKMVTVTIQMFNERGLDPVLVQLDGNTLLENIVSGLIMGDMVSYYLAGLKGVDPMPVDVIVEFKKRIGQ
jgi:glucose/mannose-6-phosphate isomerase